MLTVGLLLALTACGGGDPSAAADTNTPSSSPVSGEEEVEILQFQRVLTHCFTDPAEPAVVRIRSLTELSAYMESHGEQYDFSRKRESFGDGTLGLMDLYDDLEAQPEFFADRELLLIPITEGSSSTAYQPEALRRSGTGWTLTLRRLPAEMGVDSMGYWHLALTIPDVIPPEAEISLVIAQ